MAPRLSQASIHPGRVSQQVRNSSRRASAVAATHRHQAELEARVDQVGRERQHAPQFLFGLVDAIEFEQ
jgi:hypothetical protein